MNLRLGLRTWIAGGGAAALLAAGGIALASGFPGGPHAFGPGGGMPPGGPHGPGGPGRGVSGVVEAVSGGSFTLQARGQTYTVNEGTSTTYDFGPQFKASQADVQAGERVAVDGTTSGTSVAASAVHIMLPRDRGTVTGVSGSQVSIQEPSGRTATIQLSSAADAQVGQDVAAVGTWQQDTLVARGFAVIPPHLDGVVTSVSGETAVVRTPAGQSVTLQWSASTQFSAGPNGTASAGGVQVGQRIHAEGQSSGSTFVATRIDLPPAHRPGPGPAPAPGQ